MRALREETNKIKDSEWDKNRRKILKATANNETRNKLKNADGKLKWKRRKKI